MAVAVLGFSLVAAACGGGSTGACEEIAGDTIALIQGVVDEFESKGLAELQALDESGALDIDADMEALEAEAEEAGCSDDEMVDLLEAKVDDLEASTPLGQAMIDSIAVR